jgi:hypothetical protein
MSTDLKKKAFEFSFLSDLCLSAFICGRLLVSTVFGES